MAKIERSDFKEMSNEDIQAVFNIEDTNAMILCLPKRVRIIILDDYENNEGKKVMGYYNRVVSLLREEIISRFMKMDFSPCITEVL